MAGKQLEKVLKSIERQLFKLVLSHAQKIGDREHEAVGKKKLYKKQSFKISTFRSLQIESVGL